MKSKPLFACLVSGIALASLAAEPLRTSGVIHIEHEKVAAALASGAPLVVTNNFKVQTGNRTQPGEVEVHERDTDIFYILKGSATFVTGGAIEGAREISPGETRAKTIRGGEECRLTKGDVIVIPNRVPHWFKQVKGRVVYYVVKVAQ